MRKRWRLLLAPEMVYVTVRSEVAAYQEIESLRQLARGDVIRTRRVTVQVREGGRWRGYERMELTPPVPKDSAHA